VQVFPGFRPSAHETLCRQFPRNFHALAHFLSGSIAATTSIRLISLPVGLRSLGTFSVPNTFFAVMTGGARPDLHVRLAPIYDHSLRRH